MQLRALGLLVVLACVCVACAPREAPARDDPARDAAVDDGDDGDDAPPDDAPPDDAPPDDGPPDDAPPDDAPPDDAPACVAAAPAGCVDEGDGDFTCTLAHDGRERRYLLHVPPGYPAAATGGAVVFSFHGLRTNAALQRFISEGDAGADEGGYVVVYPEGTGPATELAWNAGTCCAGASASDVDDVGFTLAILDVLQAPLCIDDKRVYATGLSNGGHMAYRLACEQADVFAAIASVAGVTATFPCNPSRPVPVLHFHGTDDLIVPYSVGIAGQGAEATVEAWAERNGCASTASTTYQQGEVTCRAYAGCDAGSAAELCTVEGGGHTWPGGGDVLVLGHTTNDISATAYMSAFFAAHPLP